MTYPYIYNWARYKDGTPRIIEGVVRKGQRCRYLHVLKMNTAVIEFDDGTRTITCRMALRKAR